MPQCDAAGHSSMVNINRLIRKLTSKRELLLVFELGENSILEYKTSYTNNLLRN